MNPQLLKGSNSNMVGVVSDSGWINESLFVDWVHHFISYSKPSKEDPVLLILDNHESHISLEAFTLCRDHGIIMLTLPPHTSHRLQPLDLTYFGPIKTAYNQECENHMADRFGQSITQYDIVELFTNAFNRCSNLEKAASGFRAAGIYPLRPVEIESIPPYTTQEKINPTKNIQTNIQPSNNQTIDVQQASNAQGNAEIATAADQVQCDEDLDNQVSTTNPVNSPLDTYSDAEVTAAAQNHPVEDQDIYATDKEPVNFQTDDASTHTVSLSEIVELPIISPKISKRNIRKKRSIILTSTLIKDQLVEKANRKKS